MTGLPRCLPAAAWPKLVGGRRWQRSIFPWLKQFGFIQSESDPCIFLCLSRVTVREVNTPLGIRRE